MSSSLKTFLSSKGFVVPEVHRNLSPAVLYEHAIRYDPGSVILNTGALCVDSGSKTGRSPNDKRVVDEPSTTNDVNWGKVNIKMTPQSFALNRDRTISYLNTRNRLYVVDGYAGWDLRYRKKVRVICERPYHALFMHTMMIRPSAEELENFGEPDFTIMNGGKFPANRLTAGMTSPTSVDLNFAAKEMVILGTEYAGEMKKGIFTYMMYEAMKQNSLPLHASMNQAKDGTTTLFFGLSGTGKTTLSADPARRLIGDDEHVWTDTGAYNIEGGCYAKCVNLSMQNEPDIYRAIRFGAILENVAFDPVTRGADYTNVHRTENTRVAYPLEHIDGSVIPALGGHPTNVVFLTCDAFGVLPPISRLTPDQASYHFISGYTAKVAGTEQGVSEPVATFSACYGGPFLVFHPMAYAQRLAEKLREQKAHAWLVNTGWTGGAYGTGSRMKLPLTRTLIDKVHDGSLLKAKFATLPQFGLEFVSEVDGVPSNILDPRKAWKDPKQYNDALTHLAGLFRKNFEAYDDKVTPAVAAAGPSGKP